MGNSNMDRKEMRATSKIQTQVEITFGFMPNPLNAQHKDVMLHINDIDFLHDARAKECLLVHCYFARAELHYGFVENCEKTLGSKKSKHEDDAKV